MLQTYPIPLNFLQEELIFGDRTASVASEPFDVSTLKRRVLQKTKDGKKAKPAYYIDNRDLDHRLNLVFGMRGWNNNISVFDAGDRMVATAHLEIGGIRHQDISEELKSRGPRANDLAARNASAAAQKRAAVKFGIGAYLYEFKDEIIWDPIDDWSQFVDPITLAKLPKFARPTQDPQIVLNELRHLFSTEDTDDLKDALGKLWHVDTFEGMTRDDCFRLAACIARISDRFAEEPFSLNCDFVIRQSLVDKLAMDRYSNTAGSLKIGD